MNNGSDVQKIYRNPPSLDGVQVLLESGREEVITGTVWCSISFSNDYQPNKHWEETPNGRRLIVAINQGNPNKSEVLVSLTESQADEVKSHLGEGSVPAQ